MNTQTSPNEKPVHTTNEDEAVIRERSNQIGRQLGEVVANLLFEVLVRLRTTGQQAASEIQDPILTPEEVAQILKISKSKVYRMMQLGEIPSIRFGRTARVSREDLDNFIRNHSSPSSHSEAIHSCRQ